MGAHHAAQRAVGAAVLVGALWSAYCAPPAPVVASGDAVPEESFAISAVTIFDGKTFGPDQYVWVDDGSIRAVGQALDLPDGLAVVWGDPVQLAYKEPHQRNGGGQTDKHPDGHEPHSLDQYLPAYRGFAGAERHPDRQLTGSLTDGQRQDTVQP